MNLPSTSVIIASRNRHDMLESTIRSILDGKEVPTEIIIIDQSHEPHVTLSERKSYRGCDICYHWNESIGTSKARNLALHLARYEQLVIIDDDLFVADNWLKNLIEGLDGEGTKFVVSGRVLASGTSDGSFTPSTKTDDEPASYEGRVWKDVLWSNNMAMRRSVLEDVGFFDERLGPGTNFPAAEDNDYGFRILEAGYQIHYLPSAVVYHRDWRPKKEFINLRWKYGVGRGAFYAKYFSLHDQYSFYRMIGDMRTHILSALYSIPRDRLKACGDFMLAGGILVGACHWSMQYGLVHR